MRRGRVYCLKKGRREELRFSFYELEIASLEDPIVKRDSRPLREVLFKYGWPYPKDWWNLT